MIQTATGRRDRRRRRPRRPHKILRGIARNLISHPSYPWLAFDPRGVAAVEASRDLQKRRDAGARPSAPARPGEAGGDAD